MGYAYPQGYIRGCPGVCLHMAYIRGCPEVSIPMEVHKRLSGGMQRLAKTRVKSNNFTTEENNFLYNIMKLTETYSFHVNFKF